MHILATFNMTPGYLFTIVYLLLSACVIYPPTEFVSAGLTVPAVFSKFLGSEHAQFIDYHIKKSCLYLFIYSMLPLGYFLSSIVLGYASELTVLFSTNVLFWFSTLCCVFPSLSVYQILNWIRNDYEKHPIVMNLTKFATGNATWREVASNVNSEFSRFDKISIDTSSLVKVVATENWVMKITPLTIFIIHQSDASLVVKEAEVYPLAAQNYVENQYLNIEVKSGRRGVEPFLIRINSRDFSDLKDRVSRIITVMPNIRFHQTVLDRFVDVFKQFIGNNPTYKCNQELDLCISCLEARPNVKLQKNCADNSCTNCYCKPLWCADCLAKWFATTQESSRQATWLSSKCNCPICRASFCLLDICLVEEENGVA